MKSAYLVKLSTGQYGLLINTTIHLLSWEYTIADLHNYFGDSLIIY